MRWMTRSIRGALAVVALCTAVAHAADKQDAPYISKMSYVTYDIETDGRSVQDVYFQFAGMTRDAAEALTARMRAIGWAIPKPGEERVEAAAGKNEVRYNPDAVADRAAAELLAADLTAAGQPAEAKPVSIIYPDRLEIWVSI